MMLNKIEKFEEFLSKTFGEGNFSRELRLSKEEAGYVQKRYPKASMKKCVTTEVSGGKCWYEINLLTPITMMERSVNPSGFAAIQNENLMLKQELERMKRSLADVGMY
jgi:hypothetical protein